MNAPRRLPPDFSESAAYPLYAIDPAQDRAWVLHFDREDYRQANFLDQRALQHREVSGWVLNGEELRVPAPPLPSPDRTRWLFHIGHCGSTLASRLLDLLPGTLGLREPLPLLTLAHTRGEPAAAKWLPIVRRLLARGFAETEAIVVKPTSIVTTIAEQLLPGDEPACLLWVDLRTWLATMLRAAHLTDSSLSTESLRLAGIPTHAPAETVGPRLARLWLAEQLRWQQLATRPGARSKLLDLDFADLLVDPAGVTNRLAQHFGLATPGDWDSRIATSGILEHYAKDASQVFDAQARQAELDAASLRHSPAIEEGVRWARDEASRQGLPSLLERLSPRA